MVINIRKTSGRDQSTSLLGVARVFCGERKRRVGALRRQDVHEMGMR